MKKSIRAVVEPTQEEIARVAYLLFEESGRQDGHDVEHWLQAEAHLCADRNHMSSSHQERKGRDEASPV